MSDKWANSHVAVDAPADDFVPVTPSDSTDLTTWARALYITGAGNVVVDTRAGNTRTIAVPANFYLLCRVRRVRSTGTTATGIFSIE